jgi:predicted ABC-type ATPase
MTLTKPQLWIVAGPNGSGKSTLTAKYFRRFPSLLIVNPDILTIERGISPLAASKLALQLQKEYLEKRFSFLVETTFSGKHELKLMNNARLAGYKINLIYVCVSNSRILQGRVIQRVGEGGHVVPPQDIARRYMRSIEQLPLGLELADRIFVLDNTSERTRLLFCKEYGVFRNVARNFPAWAKILEQKLNRSSGLTR